MSGNRFRAHPDAHRDGELGDLRRVGIGIGQGDQRVVGLGQFEGSTSDQRQRGGSLGAVEQLDDDFPGRLQPSLAASDFLVEPELSTAMPAAAASAWTTPSSSSVNNSPLIFSVR